MPGRYDSEGEYRYGFQGQEKDDEMKGEGNSVNYTYRMHDPRVGRFFATDPLASKYPHNSPYAFSENNVIHMIELEGLEKAPSKVHYYNMVKQENGSYEASYSYSHSKLVLKTDNAVLKEVPYASFGMHSRPGVPMAAPSDVQLGVGDYGDQNRTTNVYTYWKQGKIAKQSVYNSFGVIDSPEGMILTGSALNKHQEAMWQARSSGAATSVSIAEPFVEIAHTGVSDGLQELGMGETAANYTASGLLFFGTAAIVNKGLSLKSTPTSGISPNVRNVLSKIDDFKTQGGTIKLNPMSPNQEINITFQQGIKKLDFRIETHTVPQKYGGNGISPQRHMNVDLYPNKKVITNSGHKILE